MNVYVIEIEELKIKLMEDIQGRQCPFPLGLVFTWEATLMALSESFTRLPSFPILRKSQ